MKINLFSLISTLLFEKTESCILCGRPISSSHSSSTALPNICPTCQADLTAIREPICLICGREKEDSPYFTPGETICDDCLRRKETFFLMNRSSLRYTPKAKEWLYSYKYRGRESLAEGLIPLLANTYNRYYKDLGLEGITFVPLHEERLQERTFNQAEQLAIGLGKKLNLPVYDLLIRSRPTMKQSRKGRGARIHSLKGAIIIREGADLPVGRKILLIDDLYTTGSTVNECARALQEGGWAEIYVLTPFRA